MSRIPELPGLQFRKMLGQGGTAAVCQVFSHKHNQEFALKYPLRNDPQSPATFAQLARREHHLIGHLRFPGIVEIKEISTEPSSYVLMELCRGLTLEQCGRVNELPVALNLLSAIALSLEYLRLNAIIHGDLKPHNTFLPENWQSLDGNGLFFTKLSDFSLGRFAGEPEADRIGVGTVGYMAPETIAESRSGFQSDLFALGVIAYQTLTGVHPFMDSESDPVKINSRVLEEEPTPLVELRPELDPALVALINRLLAKNKIDRPQTGWEVCVALKDVGAQYPYQKALRPAYFFGKRNSSSHAMTSLLQATDRQKRQLRLLSCDDKKALRLILTANFLRGNLRYDGQHFVFPQETYWPSILRRRTLSTFRQLPLSQKKLVVKTAIIGGKREAQTLEIIEKGDLDSIPSVTIDLVRQLIRPRVVRRFSACEANRAEKLAAYELATRLFVQSGDLTGAERCAFQATHQFLKDHRNDKALNLLNLVIDYARMIGHLADARHLLMLKGDVHKENGKADRALATYQLIIELYRRLPPDKLLAEAYKDLGDLYKMKQDFEAGLEALKKALEIYQTLGDNLEISHTFNNIGNMHWIASNYDKALIYYRKSVRMKRRLNAIPGVATSLGNIANIYVIKGRLHRAIRLMDLSLQMKKEIGNAGEIARTMNNLGYVYCLLKDFYRASSYLTESLSINRRIDSRKEILFNLENLTDVRVASGQLKDALPSLTEGIQLAEELGHKRHLAAFNVSFGRVLKRLGQFSEAGQRFESAENIIKDINEKLLLIELRIQRADLLHFIGRKQQALEFAKDTFRDARSINDKSGQLNSLMLMAKTSDDYVLAHQARSIAEELHLKREQTIVDFIVIAAWLRNGNIGEALRIATETIPELHSIEEDIELAWMCNVVAELMISKDDHETALSYLTRAENTATDGGLMPEMIVTLTLKGRINFAQRDYEHCFRNYKRALQICKNIAESIEDPSDRQCYTSQRATRFLVDEIRRLGDRMGQKKAGSEEPPCPLTV